MTESKEKYVETDVEAVDYNDSEANVSMSPAEPGLQRKMKNRHISMIRCVGLSLSKRVR